MKLFGHEALSREALAQFIEGLPPNLKFLGPLLTEYTVHHALNRDVLDVITAGHWRSGGQKHHFMRADGQSERQAYELGKRWVASNGKEAAVSLRKLFKAGSTRNFNQNFVAGPLGYAFHALQDSYAPAHVTRTKKGMDFIITRIHVYDEKNKTAHGSWPGHDALDQKASVNWRNPLGQEAVAACRELAKIVVVSALEKTDTGFERRWTSLWQTFVSVFLLERLSV